MTATLLRRAGALGLIAATTTALTGCAGVLGATMTYHDTVSTKITDIVLSGGSGDVTVTATTGAATTVTRVVRRSSNPGESYRLVGTSLTVDTSCGMNCSVAYQITAPAGVTVHGRLSSGAVRLDGMGGTDLEVTSGDLSVLHATGPVQLRSTSGDVQVQSAKGPVRVTASSGDVQALDVAGAVDVQVSSGDALVSLAAPNSVTARSGSGDVQVALPNGSYRLDTGTGSGNVDLHGLVSNAAATNVVTVRTGSGDVDVHPAP